MKSKGWHFKGIVDEILGDPPSMSDSQNYPLNCDMSSIEEENVDYQYKKLEF